MIRIDLGNTLALPSIELNTSRATYPKPLKLLSIKTLYLHSSHRKPNTLLSHNCLKPGARLRTRIIASFSRWQLKAESLLSSTFYSLNRMIEMLLNPLKNQLTLPRFYSCPKESSVGPREAYWHL
jgi:hypothetical protein